MQPGVGSDFFSREESRKYNFIINQLKKYDLDEIHRICASAIAQRQMEFVCRDESVTVSRGVPDLRKVAGADAPKRINCSDHDLILNKNGKPYCYLTQPYSMSNHSINELAELGKQHNLNITINNESFWFPGRTLAVFIKKDTD